MADWNAMQYLKFEKERTQPAIDLANRIPFPAPERLLDVGCGPGNSTAVLGNRFPQASVLGVDNSPGMIEKAASAYPGLSFRLCDVSRELSDLSGGFDVVFSNACIQWIPDHPKLLRDLMGLLKPGGMLAVQTPMNYEEPIHQIIGEVSAGSRWAAKIGIPRVFYNLTESGYYDLLSELSEDFTVWKTIYCHRMKSHQAILEWYRSTGLRPYLNALPEEDRPLFEAEIFERVCEAYPLQKNGEIIFRFPRLFFTAIR